MPSEPHQRSIWRMVFGIIGVLLILGTAAERCVSANIDRSASAIQLTQIYTEGIFFVMVVVGALIAFYIAMRKD